MLIAFLSLITLLTACGQNAEESAIVGKWQTIYQKQIITYTFKEDGTIEFANETGGIYESGKYSVKDNVLYMTFNGSTEKGTIFVSGDVMVSCGVVQTLERQYYTESDSDANGIYGIWESQLDGSTWFIDRDNTISDLLETYGFTQCGDVYVAHFITESDTASSCPIAFTYENNKITLYFGPVMKRIG